MRDLEPLAKDLNFQFGSQVDFLEINLETFDPHALYKEAKKRLVSVDNLFIIAGWSDPISDSGPVELEFLSRIVEVNFKASCMIVNVFLEELASNPKSNLVGIGSVASVRGRNKNMIYAASKSGLETYFESYRHWLSKVGGGNVQFYRLGIIDTSMSQDSSPFPKCHPKKLRASS